MYEVNASPHIVPFSRKVMLQDLCGISARRLPSRLIKDDVRSWRSLLGEARRRPHQPSTSLGPSPQTL